MEGTGDVNATVDNAVQDLHIRSKESDQSLRLDSCNVVGAPAVLLSRENEWMEPHSLRSPEHFSETLEDQVLLRPRSFDIGSGQLSSSPLILNSSDIMVEELTMNNYKSSNLTVGCSNKKEESPMSKGQWRHLYLLSGGCRIGSSPMDTVSKEPVMLDGRDEDARNMFSPNYLFQNLQSSKHVVEGHHGISELLTNSTLTNFPGERRTKVLPRSGFSEFFVRNTLKGKGAAHGDLQIHGESEIVNLNNVSEKMICDGVAPNTWQGSGAKADHLSINIGASAGAASGHDRINLREWLKPGCHKINKVESLQIFKQILELVDFAHSQGVVLKDLKPSYFMIVSSDKVQYVGSWVTQIYSKLSENVINQEDHYSTHHLKRKGSMEDGMNRNSVLARRHQKLSENVELVGQQPRSAARFGLKIGTMMKGDIMSLRENASGYCLREEQILNKRNRTLNVSGCPSEYTKHMQLTSEGVNLEERWYTSPEDLSYRMCTLESNIYCLGVLMFELFCCFESSEVHTAAMSDLRHRILPSYFLSEKPKEAGFCLWLLHPEPSSRPKTREILNSELICEGRDLSSLDQSSVAVDEEDAESELLLHFLLSLKEQKEKLASKLVENVGSLDTDIKEVEKRHSLRTERLSQTYKALNVKDAPSGVHDILDECHHYGSLRPEAPSRESKSGMHETSLTRNIKQLENVYFSVRSRIQPPEIDTAERSDKDVLKNRDSWSSIQNDSDWCINDNPTDRLGLFFNGICKYARYSKFEVLGILRNRDLLNSANVICSLSFDRDQDYFAAAGVSKKIKIFEFGSLLNDTLDIHYPVVEMSSKSKLSCVCWNNYIKNYLASTDYDGVVQLWDASTGQGFSHYKEHQKRAWSVDFSQVDPTKLASGSDDYSVKLWSINEANCIGTIKNVANVCCVQFSSHSSHLLAFGSADYKTYCYDLRNTRIPWCTLAGHGKAVSYVKFLDSCTLVSASTDNTLKIWDLNKTTYSGLSTNASSLTLSGHMNEKNFVGLSVSDGYIACGSETNEVFAYYKSLPMPMTSHKFGTIDPISGQETADDNGQFVSSVCWRGKSNMVVAANSNGCIKLLQMV